MLELKRIGDEVYYKDQRLTQIKQSKTKDGKERPNVVIIDGLPGTNGQKHMSITKLVEGLNVFNDNDLKGREVNKDYELTEEEQERVNELQGEIDDIIEAAKARYVKPIKVKKITDLTKMSKSELEAEIERLNRILEEKRGE